MDQSTCDTIQIYMNQEDRIIKVLEKVANGLDDIKTQVTIATTALNSINSCVSGLSEEIRDAAIQMKQGKQHSSNSFGGLQPTSALALHHTGSPSSPAHNYQGPVENFTSSSHFNIQNTKGNSTFKEEKNGGLLKKQPIIQIKKEPNIQRFKSLSEFQRERVIIEPKNQQHRTKAQLAANMATNTNANKPKKPVQKKPTELIQKLASSSSQSRERVSEQSISSQLSSYIKNCYIVLNEIMSEDQSIDYKQYRLEKLKDTIESQQKEQSKKKHVFDVIILTIINTKLQLTINQMKR